MCMTLSPAFWLTVVVPMPCSVYNEKRVSIEGAEGEKKEYRVWNPFR